ncbi:MAG TPA: hypothetical protein VJZ76_14915 [Thermoanaerobaculia bacterium]|nr:hypothetical protein [Thermoanaerobaculia bacterium]
MANSYKFKLTLLFNQTIPDLAGDWQYAAATAVDQNSQAQALLVATKRTNASLEITPPFVAPASMLTATVMFLPITKGNVPSNMTLQGIHMLDGTDMETGSVSAASGDLADQIGGAFAFENGILTIDPPTS